MTREEIAVEYGNDLSVDDYSMLRQSVEWSEIPGELIRQAIDRSDYIISAKTEGITIGMARLITDGTQALIMDVILHPNYQGYGIGKTMMRNVMEFLNSSLRDGQHILVNLNATKGRESFYTQFGFEIRPTERFGMGMAQWIHK